MLIAHRLSTIRWADLIYVIEDGQGGGIRRLDDAVRQARRPLPQLVRRPGPRGLMVSPGRGDTERNRRTGPPSIVSPGRTGGDGCRRGTQRGSIASAPSRRAIMNPADETARDRSRRLRAESTAEERKLWRHLRAKHFEGFKFRRQHDIRCADGFRIARLKQAR